MKFKGVIVQGSYRNDRVSLYLEAVEIIEGSPRDLAALDNHLVDVTITEDEETEE